MVGVTVHPLPRLFGRTGELEILGRLIAKARSGQSAVLVVRGESGIGKTELLRHLIVEAPGFCLARVVGVRALACAVRVAGCPLRHTMTVIAAE